MNQVALVGNITDDPTLRYTQSGQGSRELHAGREPPHQGNWSVAGRDRRSFETDGQKRTTVEIVASQIGADLQFATAEITKRSAGDSPAPAETSPPQRV